MTNCAYEGCGRDATGSVLWITDSMRNYCNAHLRQVRADFPELIEEVSLL